MWSMATSVAGFHAQQRSRERIPTILAVELSPLEPSLEVR